MIQKRLDRALKDKQKEIYDAESENVLDLSNLR